MSSSSYRGYLSAGALGIRNQVCVLPCGGLSPQDDKPWSTADLAPYVHNMLAVTTKEPMFEGFVFQGIGSRPGRFMHPLYTAFGEPADSNDWLKWIEDLFAKDCNLHALYLQTERELDVWVSVPYPFPLQSRFGNVKGRTLDFQHEEDRWQAIEWWIDRLLERIDEATELTRKLRFRGFVWPRDSIDVRDEPLAIRTNRYIKTKGFLSLWLPHYGSYGALKFSQLGFDAAAIHANYYGNTEYGIEWLNHAALFARMAGAGFQIIAGKGILYNDTHLIDYLNHGLPDANGYMLNSFLAYRFPEQRLRELLATRPSDYERLHAFIKGAYVKVSNPGIAY